MKRISESQVFVDESDRHAAFANTACNSLDGTMTNVTRAEYARDAGWRLIRLPIGSVFVIHLAFCLESPTISLPRCLPLRRCYGIGTSARTLAQA